MAPLQVARARTEASIDSAQFGVDLQPRATVQRLPVALVEPTAPDAPMPALGASVRLTDRLPYLKTADPMPMLRPPDLVEQGEVGQVVGLRSQGMLAVRFRRGTFLIAAAAVDSVPGS